MAEGTVGTCVSCLAEHMQLNASEVIVPRLQLHCNTCHFESIGGIMDTSLLGILIFHKDSGCEASVHKRNYVPAVHILGSSVNI